jgi:hypothetical protein
MASAPNHDLPCGNLEQGGVVTLTINCQFKTAASQQETVVRVAKFHHLASAQQNTARFRSRSVCSQRFHVAINS